MALKRPSKVRANMTVSLLTLYSYCLDSRPGFSVVCPAHFPPLCLVDLAQGVYKANTAVIYPWQWTLLVTCFLL